MKEKGFTLIELLAVIVILAIIALIATPIILNIIDNSKEESNKRSIDMYAKAIENAIAEYQLKEKKSPNEFKDIEKYIKYDGATVICESVSIKPTVSLSACSVNGKSVENYVYGQQPEVDNTIVSSITTKYEKNGQIPEKPSNTSQSGLFSTLDLDGTTYYFSGDVEDNYVGFKTGETLQGYYSCSLSIEDAEEICGMDMCPTYSNTETFYSSAEECYEAQGGGCDCQATGNVRDVMLYFRIVRINGDGTIRLIYDGKSVNPVENGVVRDSYIEYNDNYISNIPYGPFLQEWYDTNLKDNYDSYIVSNQTYEDLGKPASYNTGDGAVEPYYFKSYERYGNSTPSLESDAYKKSSYANKVGLITMDEVILAGGIESNNTYYLYAGKEFATLTKSYDHSANGYFYVDDTGKLYGSFEGSHSGYGVLRPVINLVSNVPFTGSGTLTDPYIIG